MEPSPSAASATPPHAALDDRAVAADSARSARAARRWSLSAVEIAALAIAPLPLALLLGAMGCECARMLWKAVELGMA